MDTFLGSLVQSCCGQGGALQTNNTGMCSQCLSHTGSAPAQGACVLPAHTAQALGCSAGTSRGQPWASCTSQVYAAQVQALGQSCVLCPSQVPAAQVFGERSHCALSPPPSLPLGFLAVQPAHILRRMLTVQNPKKLVSKEACLQFCR